MSELIGSLGHDRGADEDHNSRYPATTTPLQHYTEAVLSELERGLIRDNDDSWNALVRNIDLQVLRTDFRSKSIEYLLHPERLVFCFRSDTSFMLLKLDVRHFPVSTLSTAHVVQ